MEDAEKIRDFMKHVTSFKMHIKWVLVSQIYFQEIQIILDFSYFVNADCKILLFIRCNDVLIYAFFVLILLEASNTLLARLCTRIAKPNGIYRLEDDKVEDFMKTWPVRDLPGKCHWGSRLLSILKGCLWFGNVMYVHFYFPSLAKPCNFAQMT